MKKRFLTILLVGVLAFSSLTACIDDGNDEKSNISYLYVDTYSGGFGQEFLEAVEEKFEEAYVETSFAPDKKGVDIVVSSSGNNQGGMFKDAIKSSNHDIHVLEGLNYYDYLEDGSILDITNWVQAPLTDSKTIESKLFDDQKAALTAAGGKYYSLPTFAGFTGFTYDARLLRENNLYFADDLEAGNYPFEKSSYTGDVYTGRGFIPNENVKKSCGPDGKYDSYDDGLPSSYEEFFYLLDQMLSISPKITPFIGLNNHYFNYIFASLLNANLTKNEMIANFTFNSNGQKVRVIDSFTGETPNVEEVVITQDNGYLISKEYGKYQALKFLEHLFTGSKDGVKYYDSRCEGKSLSNTQTQKVYIESALDSKQTSIAFLVEGNYWYNEARGNLEASVSTYKDKAVNREFSYLPLPAIETGTITENNGYSLTLTDNLEYYLVVNSKVARNEEKLKLAEAFIKFMYTDEILQEMTVASGIPFALKYEMGDKLDEMENYEKSLWNAYKVAKDGGTYVTPLSGNPIFQNQNEKFAMKTTKNFFNSKIGGLEKSTPHTTFWNNEATAKTYFQGMEITESIWNSVYNVYDN